MEVLPGPQPMNRPVFASVENHHLESMDTTDFERTDREDEYLEINFREKEGSNSPNCCDEAARSSGNFRAELKRPDLKGSFRCSICSKVFCHSSSLSRHRMQAHFKSYKCTLCRKDITSNETLRAHMYKQHQVSRMFMCRCCNWAFPDKTSLHMHIQAREEGKPMPVSVIGKGIGPTDRVGPMIDRSAFAPVNTVGNTLPPLPPPNVGPTVPPPGGLPFFPSATQPLPPSPEELSRIRERLMLNSLMTQPGFSLGWLSQLPKPIPTTRPSIGLPKPPEDDLVVNVDKDDEKCDDDDEKQVSGSDSDEPKSESSRLAKRSDSPCENGSSSSTDGSSPSHASSAHSPINLFKKDPEMPSAFHQLNVDSRPFGTSPHVSPSDTNSSISPDGSCFECAVFKTKLSIAENKCRYMESRANTLQTEAVRAQSSAAAAEATVRVLENETRALREHADQLQRRLLDCQEQALRFVQSERTQSPQAVALFLNQLIQSTIVR